MEAMNELLAPKSSNTLKANGYKWSRSQ